MHRKSYYTILIYWKEKRAELASHVILLKWGIFHIIVQNYSSILYSVLWIVTFMFVMLIFMFLTLLCIPHLPSIELVLRQLQTFLNLWLLSVFPTQLCDFFASSGSFCMDAFALLLSQFFLYYSYFFFKFPFFSILVEIVTFYTVENKKFTAFK